MLVPSHRFAQPCKRTATYNRVRKLATETVGIPGLKTCLSDPLSTIAPVILDSPFGALAHRTLSNLESKPLMKPLDISGRGQWMCIGGYDPRLPGCTHSLRRWVMMIGDDGYLMDIHPLKEFSQSNEFHDGSAKAQLSKKLFSSSAAAGLVKGGLTKYLPRLQAGQDRLL